MPKTIFGTTEKSNFILNMKSATLNKWINGVLIFAILFPLIGAIILTGTDVKTFLSGAFLYATGFTCVLFFLIVALKKEVQIKNVSYITIIIMAFLGLVTYYLAFSRISGSGFEVTTPLLGNLGRQEGYVALLSYFGIFLLATTVTTRKSVYTLFNVLIATGFVQSVVAILQHIPNGVFPSDYRNLNSIQYENVNLSSGFTDNPIFFGSLMTILTGIAIVATVYEKSNKKAIVYSIASLLFFLTSLFTSSIVPFIGIGTALILLIVVQIINAKKGKQLSFDNKLFKNPTTRLIGLIAGFGIVFLVVALTQGINICDVVGVRKMSVMRDKAIAFQDSFYRLFISGSMVPVNPQNLYSLVWSNSIDLIKQFPLFGTGQDCMAIANYMNGLTNDFLDKSYNEYLYVAVTRGIPALLAYLTFVVFTIKNLIKNIRKFTDDNYSWFRVALFVAITAYLVQAFFSVSTITVAPFFWLLAGLSWSSYKKDNN